MKLPERNKYRIKYILKSYNDVLFDGIELPIQRPKASDLQKVSYNGKKTHNMKNNLLSLPDRRINWLSKTFDDSVHDKKVFDIQPLHFTSNIALRQDTGFRYILRIVLM